MVHSKNAGNHFINFMCPYDDKSFYVMYFFHPFCAIRIVQNYKTQEVDGINIFPAEGLKIEEVDLKPKKRGIKKS